jgi:hypothetical protein
LRSFIAYFAKSAEVAYGELDESDWPSAQIPPADSDKKRAIILLIPNVALFLFDVPPLSKAFSWWKKQCGGQLWLREHYPFQA